MCDSMDDGVWSVIGMDGSIRLSPRAATMLREAMAQMDVLLSTPTPEDGLEAMRMMLQRLRALEGWVQPPKRAENRSFG